MKLAKAFTCVPAGEIYPVEIAAGEDCPPEHEESARALGLLEEPAKGGKGGKGGGEAGQGGQGGGDGQNGGQGGQNGQG